LNSRKPNVPELEGYPLAANSVFGFGLADLTQVSNAGSDASNLLMSIAQTVRTHEPRIRDPRVFLVRAETLTRSIRFHLEGRLMFENGEEEISFDTVLEMTSGEYEVK
jgi:type VI secretion system protein ImpF